MLFNYCTHTAHARQRASALTRAEIEVILISDTDVFGGSSLRSSFSTSDSVTTCREKLCNGAGEKAGGALGLVALEGVGDEEMFDGQGGLAESNRNPDLRKW